MQFLSLFPSLPARRLPMLRLSGGRAANGECPSGGRYESTDQFVLFIPRPVTAALLDTAPPSSVSGRLRRLDGSVSTVALRRWLGYGGRLWCGGDGGSPGSAGDYAAAAGSAVWCGVPLFAHPGVGGSVTSSVRAAAVGWLRSAGDTLVSGAAGERRTAARPMSGSVSEAGR